MSAAEYEVPSQSGRTVVVTGADSGIGFETARRLALAGGHVVLACRNLERGQGAAERIAAASDSGPILGSTEVRLLDTSSLDSVRGFAESFDGPIDVLINNAGIMAVDESRSPEGFELQLATNYLGAFALTARLLGRVTDRVVMLSSAAHRIGRIALEDLQWLHRPYSRWGAYAQSKLADLMLAYELQHRLIAAGSPLRAVAAHPGVVSTDLTTGDRMPASVEAVSTAIINGFGQAPAQGALPTLYAATVPDLPGGSFIGPASPAGLRGAPVPVGSSRRSQNRDIQRLLVAESERLTGVPLRITA